MRGIAPEEDAENRMPWVLHDATHDILCVRTPPLRMHKGIGQQLRRVFAQLERSLLVAGTNS